MNPSEQQERIINEILAKKEGRFIVRACPGSGKTFTIAYLLAKEYGLWERSHRGIAVLSFTNAAKDEILEKIKRDAGYQSKIGHPHFIGTIDSFLNNCVFLPFGGTLMKYNGRPKLVGGIHSVWYPPRLGRIHEHNYFEKTTFNKDGCLVKDAPNQHFHFKWEKKDGSLHATVKKIEQSKYEFFKNGLATQNDANYFSYKVLKENTYIARLLAGRYPYIIVDEAQDTSEIQMAIIDILEGSGIEKVVLVGDPDQAIYEWNNARPDLFLSKIDDPTWVSTGFDLRESFRSSEKICSFASKFSKNKFRPEHNNDVKDYGEPVRVLSWNPKRVGKDIDDISCIVSEFEKRCISLGINFDDNRVAVLARSSELKNSIKNLQVVRDEKPIDWHSCKNIFTRDACLARYYYDNGNFVEACRSATKWCFKAKHGKKYPSEEEIYFFVETEKGGSNAVFKGSMEACYFKLPSTKTFPDIGAWLEQAKVIGEPAEPFQGMAFCDSFSRNEKNASINEFFYSTIHGIKGKTFDAVLLFLKSKGGSGSNYTTVLKKEFDLSDKKMEEMRNVFVAITRPRKLLWIAVPECDCGDWETFLVS